MSSNRASSDGSGDRPAAGFHALEIPALEVIERLLSDSPRPRAREAFRLELKRAFVAGSPALPSIESVPFLDAVPPLEPGVLAARRPRMRRAIGSAAALGAAAGVVWFAVAELAPRSAPRIEPRTGWSVRHASSGAEAERLLGSIERDGSLEIDTPEPVDLDFNGSLHVRAMPGSHLRSLASPAPSGIPAPVGLEGGELLVKLDPEHTGPPLEIRTPQASVRIVSSCASVLVEELGTCVCVTEGDVRAKPLGAADEERVEPGTTWFWFARPNERFGPRFHGGFFCDPSPFGPGEQALHLVPLMRFEAASEH